MSAGGPIWKAVVELWFPSGGHGLQHFIANGHVAVPAQTWKVIIVLPLGSNDLSRVTTSTRTIAGDA